MSLCSSRSANLGATRTKEQSVKKSRESLDHKVGPKTTCTIVEKNDMSRNGGNKIEMFSKLQLNR